MALRRPKLERAPRPCGYCGKTFEPTDERVKTVQHFCDVDCRERYKHRIQIGKAERTAFPGIDVLPAAEQNLQRCVGCNTILLADYSKQRKRCRPCRVARRVYQEMLDHARRENFSRQRIAFEIFELPVIEFERRQELEIID